MMGYGYGYDGGWGMMGGGFSVFGVLICLVVLIDLILAGVWLWQNIAKK